MSGKIIASDLDADYLRLEGYYWRKEGEAFAHALFDCVSVDQVDGVEDRFVKRWTGFDAIHMTSFVRRECEKRRREIEVGKA